VGHLFVEWGCEPFATIDPEEFHNFTETRPHVRLAEGMTRRIHWPEHTFSWAKTDDVGDVVLFRAVEPELRWRTYTETIAGLAQSLGCRLVVTLGALLTDTPHTRPVRVTGTAHNQQLVERLGLTRSHYEGPTGIVGVVHDALARAGIASASLWAGVPHYLGRAPAPPATLALVSRVAELLEVDVDVERLRMAATEWREEVDEAVRDDDEASAYVATLEAADDEEVQNVDVEGLAAEAERFLREQG
jgi:proteasome assembly chaperone (PAC2) family protein